MCVLLRVLVGQIQEAWELFRKRMPTVSLR
jgi:hypothetical protein